MTANQGVYVVIMAWVNGMNISRPVFRAFSPLWSEIFYAQHRRLYDLKLRDVFTS